MKTIWVAGARPNFMKIAPIWRAMEAHNATSPAGVERFEPILVHTGQHYDANMSEVFFRDLRLPKPQYHLGVGGGSHAEQVAKILVSFEAILEAERPDAVGVVGDVNSTCACALATKKAHVLLDGQTPLLIHVEAGLRSGDRLMPEEINRLVTDAIADVLLTSEPSGTANLLAEGVPPEKVVFVGNVMVDSLLDTLARCQARGTTEILGLDADIRNGAYGLMTLHRPSNVDRPRALDSLMTALAQISEKVPIFFPVHPRTRARLESLPIMGDMAFHERNRLIVLDPLGYDDFVTLMHRAAFVITDSGGIQEETTALGVPCLTLRENTERPITVEVGTNVLLGQDTARLMAEVVEILEGRGKHGHVPALWDGQASERIVAVLARWRAWRK